MAWRARLEQLRVPTRAVSDVPLAVRWLLAAALIAQCTWHGLTTDAVLRADSARDLPQPPPVALLRTAAFGEPVALARAGNLWLQFFDHQPGVSIPYRELDYERLRAWLSRWLALDPDSDYPLLLAVRLYAQVADPARQRRMIAFVRAAFRERPAQRWRWLAEATLIARHRLGDAELALACARTLVEHAPAKALPYWARELPAFILEDMGELEAARRVVAGLLASGEITDPAEIAFLERWLQALAKGRTRGGERESPPE